MSTVSETAGPPEGAPATSDTSPEADKGARRGTNRAAKSGSGGPPRSAKKSAAGSAKKTASESAAGKKTPARKSAAQTPDRSSPASPQSGEIPKPEKENSESSSPEREGGGNGAPPPPGGGDGDGPSSGAPETGPSGGIALPWGRYALYGLAGLLGGAIVASVLLLADGRGARQEQLEALQTRLEKVESPGAAGPPAGRAATRAQANLEQISEELVRLDAKLAQLSGQLTRSRAQLAGRLESLEAATPGELPEMLRQWSNTVDELGGRVARLERDEMTRDVRRAALALSLANLTRATETSRPFVNELQAMAALDADHRLVAELKPFAESGLPSVPALTGRFDKVADEVVKVWRKEHGRGIFEWLWDSIVGLFSVRPVGDVEGMDAPAIVARAEQRLQEGELQSAVQELEKLGPAEKAAAGEWLEAARARLRLNELMSRVNLQVLEEIAQAAAERETRRESFVPAEPGEAPGAADPSRKARPQAEPEEGSRPEAPAPDAEAAPEPETGAFQSEGEADDASER